ncbi:hypothetical protein EDD18DRAFT_1408346 [Armillaria luteobubalina]|uniref:Uncharacterized protein n=1 Tax=Armillaria luteobubalina TaxID=153913 RepID=A0AA39PZA1_9AGAR|nr:hypothetical protein EDD18DRAFT_1408346 [Armillaria luteobubalina]
MEAFGTNEVGRNEVSDTVKVHPESQIRTALLVQDAPTLCRDFQEVQSQQRSRHNERKVWDISIMVQGKMRGNSNQIRNQRRQEIHTSTFAVGCRPVEIFVTTVGSRLQHEDGRVSISWISEERRESFKLEGVREAEDGTSTVEGIRAGLSVETDPHRTGSWSVAHSPGSTLSPALRLTFAMDIDYTSSAFADVVSYDESAAQNSDDANPARAVGRNQVHMQEVALSVESTRNKFDCT